MGENCVAKSLQKFQFLHLLTQKKSCQRKKCFKQKLQTILRYRWRLFLILTKSQKCGLESQKCLPEAEFSETANCRLSAVFYKYDVIIGCFYLLTIRISLSNCRQLVGRFWKIPPLKTSRLTAFRPFMEDQTLCIYG